MKPSYLKAFLYAEDFFEMPDNVIKTKGYILQDYKFHFRYKRDENNNPYGHVVADYMELTVNASLINDSMVFYDQMQRDESHVYSIIFNPVFNAYERMVTFEDGIVFNGYVIDVEESCPFDDDNGAQQLQVKVKLMLNNIAFLSTDSVHYLTISND